MRDHLKKTLWRREMRTARRKASELKETKSLYSSQGHYTPERQALHMDILKKISKKPFMPKHTVKPTAILLGGGSATGKTTLRESIIEKECAKKGIRPVTVDADEIKEYLPEYTLLKHTHPTYAAALVHKESRDIADMLLKRLLRERSHLVYEGTMAKARKYKKLIGKLHRADYEVHAYVVDVPVKVAKKRAIQRAKQTGRTIPPHVIENTHKLVPRTFQTIKDSVDSYHVYDNQDGLTLIATNGYVHAPLYNQFMKKGGKK
ncbi:zeta toxin family protein [Shouchella shacheensis]|uniref:zeta toxin family protein n=1 Tax=Shouchella shacheensis TaxID=1649580 RepID=UPI0007400314|nr:zeta toxin family protein [Shouchella shacheensis]